MRAFLIAILLVATAATGSATVHVSAADKARAEHVKQWFSRELGQAKLPGATYDLAVRDSLVTVSKRHVEIRVELQIAISDRNGQLISVARASANASGSHKAIATLRDQATTTAIEAAIERVRSARHSAR